MYCPHCSSKRTTFLKSKTNLGYKKLYCRSCCRQYNERTGTKFNFIEFPNEIVMMVVHYYYRFKVSLDDVVELMTMRNINLSHQTVHNWVHTFGVELGIKLREQRKGKVGKKWHTDPTYIKIAGHWCYLYRAIDKEGNLVDVYLSDTRDQKATDKFFKQALEVTEVTPEQITTDKEHALYQSITDNFPESTKHRDSKFMNNRIEQNHRGIKSRYKVMKCFKDPFCALIFCTVFEEIQQLFLRKDKSRAERRCLLSPKIQEFNDLLKIAA